MLYVLIMQECTHAVCTSSCRSARMLYVLHHAGVHACHMYFIMRCLSTSHNVIHCHPACL